MLVNFLIIRKYKIFKVFISCYTCREIIIGIWVKKIIHINTINRKTTQVLRWFYDVRYNEFFFLTVNKNFDSLLLF